MTGGSWTAEIVIATVAVAVVLWMFALGAWEERRDRKRAEREARAGRDGPC